MFASMHSLRSNEGIAKAHMLRSAAIVRNNSVYSNSFAVISVVTQDSYFIDVTGIVDVLGTSPCAVI